MLPVKRMKINQTSNEEMGGKYEIITGQLAQLNNKRKRSLWSSIRVIIHYSNADAVTNFTCIIAALEHVQLLLLTRKCA
jgi:hypothetical protein